MAGKNQIASIALQDLGGQAVSDFDNETSKEAVLIQNYWDFTVDEVLSEHQWNFAKKWKALAIDQDTTDNMITEQWEYAYQLPSDYLLMGKEETQKTLGTNYEIIGDLLYANVEDLKIQYIARISDTTKWRQWFQNAIVARLRSRLQIPLAKRGTKTIEWYQIYLVELGRAKTADATQSNETEEQKGNLTNENDTWIQSNKIGVRS